MAFDYKKEYKEFYMPKNKPGIIEIPKMNYIAVRGKGDPNEESGEYKNSIGLLYGIAFTIKMSYKGAHKIEGFFEYVVPPLEGLWWQENTQGLDYARKEDMHFVSMIRLPDFVTKEDFEWAVEEATKKKKQDFSKVEFFPYDEGLCVQCMSAILFRQLAKLISVSWRKNLRVPGENGWSMRRGGNLPPRRFTVSHLSRALNTSGKPAFGVRGIWRSQVGRKCVNYVYNATKKTLKN